MKRQAFALLSLCLGAAFPSLAHGQRAAPTSSGWKTAWSYSGALGPEHWADLDPASATCRSGEAQSPIDIRDAVTAPLPALHFEYHDGPL